MAEVGEVINIDFRWVKRSVPAPEVGKNVGRNIEVLQVRKQRIECIMPECTTYAWDEWEDIRKETEE